jgi:hypothetical protein
MYNRKKAKFTDSKFEIRAASILRGKEYEYSNSIAIFLPQFSLIKNFHRFMKSMKTAHKMSA